MPTLLPNENQNNVKPLTYFVCTDCETSFSVDEALYTESAFHSKCPNCDREIRIQTSQAQSSMMVLELFGCEFKFIDRQPRSNSVQKPQSKEEILNWIDMAQEKGSANIDAITFDKEKSFIDDLVAKWVVKSKMGEKEYEYFSVLRQAIELGEIDGKDQIVAPDGNRFHVATYPGTSDLFGNSFIKNAARSKITGHGSKIKKIFNFTKMVVQVSGLLGVSLFLGSFAFYGPQYYKQWQQYQGKKVVSKLTEKIENSSQESVENLSAQAQEIFRAGNPEGLPTVILKYQKALAKAPTSPEIMLGLAEALAEESSLTATSSDLVHAHQLVSYANTLALPTPLSIRAEARILWREGKSNEALFLLENQGSTTSQENENILLMAKIAETQGDFTKASLRLNELLQKDPGNFNSFVLFSKLFERQNKYDQAIIYLQKAAKMNPAPNTYSEQIASLYEKQGDIDSAAHMYLQAIQKGTNGEENRYRLTKLYYEQKRTTDTITAALEFLSNHAESKYEPEIRNIYQASVALLKPETAPTPHQHRRFSRG